MKARIPQAAPPPACLLAYRLEEHEEALGRLEKIVAEIENPQTAVGDIPAKVREAASLLTYCRRMLKESEESIGKILEEQ